MMGRKVEKCNSDARAREGGFGIYRKVSYASEAVFQDHLKVGGVLVSAERGLFRKVKYDIIFSFIYFISLCSEIYG